uniref:Uncharacterized protein n=1 Tax=Glycine max TaxID=3847 RepID=C6T5R2_SOYBN|nr:unknown [Glycine max]
MQVAVQPLPCPHVLQSNDCATFNGVTLFSRSSWLRSYNPITIGIVNTGETSNRLLSTARTVGHVMRMQPKFGLLVHKLQNRAVSNLHLDAFGGSGGCGGRRSDVRVESDEEEESEGEESESHEEEQCDEPVLLPDRKIGFRWDPRFAVNDPGRPGSLLRKRRRRRRFSSREVLRGRGSHGSKRVRVSSQIGRDR